MKPIIETIAERLDNHIETDDKAWLENKECLQRIENKLDVACDWINQQKAKIGMSKYIAGVIGGVFVLVADKIWR